MRNRKAFTINELIVVIAIISLLIGLLLVGANPIMPALTSRSGSEIAGLDEARSVLRVEPLRPCQEKREK